MIQGTRQKRIQKITVSVIGSHDATPKTAKLAYSVGKMVAELDCILVCGGLQGLMKEACRGAKAAGGLTIGILPGKEKADANEFVDIALPTTIGYSRNVIVAASADIVIALPGSFGTESEICYARVYGRPVINLGGWKMPGLIRARNLADATRIMVRLMRDMQHGECQE
ncbi:MAG: TIGR00725 family protein [Candidatus Omnitrophica bacterium]|nr:TIGR00725 family protein [Candidatus Omnitrophota bacterium]